MNCGRIDAQDLRGLANRYEFPCGRLRRWLETRNLAIAAQAADLIGGEAFAGGAFASLSIQDSGDNVIGIKSSQAMQQRERIFVGANPTRLRTGRHRSSSVSAPPRQRSVK